MGAPPTAGWPTLRDAWYRGRIGLWDALPSGRPCPHGLPAYRDAPSPRMTCPRVCSAPGKLRPHGLPAHRDALPWGCPTHMACQPIGMPGCSGKIGPWEALPSRTCRSSLAPGSSPGMAFVAGDRGCSAPCCPRPGLYPEEMAALWVCVPATRPPRPGAAAWGWPGFPKRWRGPRLAPRLSSRSRRAHGAGVFQARRPRPPGRTGRAPDEARSAWQSSEPGCAPAPTAVKLEGACRPVRVARVEPRAGAGRPSPAVWLQLWPVRGKESSVRAGSRGRVFLLRGDR